MIRFLLAAAALVLMITPMAVAEDKEPEMDSATQAMMAEWAKYSSPAEQHKQLERFVGKWAYRSKMWMDPNQPMESKGTVEVSPILGGRFFRFHYQGETMGMPYEGFATVGYDLYKKMYVNHWIDNMGTMMLPSTGTGNPTGTEVIYSGAYDDPMTKAMKSYREVFKWVDGDTWVFEWHEGTPGQAELKTMEMTHTRVK